MDSPGKTTVVCHSCLRWIWETADYRFVWYVPVFGIGWTCDCEAFVYGGDKNCEHIAEAKANRCAWNEERKVIDVESLPRGKDERGVEGPAYPKCGGPVEWVTMAI